MRVDAGCSVGGSPHIRVRSAHHATPTRVAILHPTDLLAHTPNGIDNYVRTILKFAPRDVQITLFGACARTSQVKLGEPITSWQGNTNAIWVPIIRLPAPGNGRLPLIARYAAGLVRGRSSGLFKNFEVLDFHRVEPSLVFRLDSRPKSLVMHQDISGVIDKASEIRWQSFSYGYRLLEKALLPAFGRAFLVRRQSLPHYVQLFPKRAGRFQFRPTFVDTTEFYPTSGDADRNATRAQARSNLGISEHSRILIYVGRLDRAKDPLMLVRAMSIAARKDADLHLVIIGDGALRQEVENGVRDTGLCSRVSLLGSLDKNTIRALLQASDLFFLPSSYEGMPLAVLEALACGIPVVAAKVGEIENILIDGKNGFLTPDRSAAAYASTIDVALRAAVQMRGPPCTRSIEHFSADVVLPHVYEQYRELARP